MNRKQLLQWKLGTPMSHTSWISMNPAPKTSVCGMPMGVNNKVNGQGY